MIQFSNVNLQYDSSKHVIESANFRIDKGEYIYLTGNNGAGKTTLLSLIHMRLQPSSGHIRILGHDITRCGKKQKSALRKKIGILSQEVELIEHITVFDNIALPLRLAQASEKNIQTSTNELLEWLELEKKSDSLPTNLSGGERQRIALARAVINRPSLILADEPTAHIDINSTKKILLLLEELNRLGTTVIMSTHDQWILDNFPHRRLHLQNGIISIMASNTANALHAVA